MAEIKQKFSYKFYLGVFLVLFSLIIGKLTQIVFIFYFDNLFLRWFSIIIYIMSWPMLIVGALFAGKEYAKSLKRYFSYRFYHKSLKEKTKKVYGKARERLRKKKKLKRN